MRCLSCMLLVAFGTFSLTAPASAGQFVTYPDTAALQPPNFYGQLGYGAAATPFSTGAWLAIYPAPWEAPGARAPRLVFAGGYSSIGGEIQIVRDPGAPSVTGVNFYLTWFGDAQINNHYDGQPPIYNYTSLMMWSPFRGTIFHRYGEWHNAELFSESIVERLPLDNPSSINVNFALEAVAGSGHYPAGGIYGSASASSNLVIEGITVTTSDGERIPINGWYGSGLGPDIPVEPGITIVLPDSLVVPEPEGPTIALIGVSCMALLYYVRRRNRRPSPGK